ncbi:hypothetical protein [Micromonospora palythoicola]|uniref:hypothetical protein n=1 Tax=Micromonospora palythoicola TaxID=3120507 RepID=UPI002FCE2F22
MRSWRTDVGNFSHVSYGQQRVVRRRVALWAIPVTLLALLAINLTWEIVRKIVVPPPVERWPWRFQVLDAPPTVALIAVTSSIIVLCVNLTHASRPTLGYGDNLAEDCAPASCTGLSSVNGARAMHFYNAGPGVAAVTSIKYSLMLTDEALESDRVWLTEEQFRTKMIDSGFVDRADFCLFSTDRGAPMPVVKNCKEGFLFLIIAEEAVLRVAGIDVLLRVRDGFGNEHGRVLRVAQSLNRSAGQKDAVYKEKARITRKAAAEVRGRRRR